MPLEMRYQDNRFIWLGDYHSCHIPKQAGFIWIGDYGRKVWWTQDKAKAQRLIQYADESAKEQLAEREQVRKASRAEDADIEIPTPAGLTVRGYQKAGVNFFVGKDGVLLADEMGTGKSIITLSYINYNPRVMYVLVVCPAHLKINWQREAEKWLVRDFKIGVVRGNNWPEDCNLVIINYEILKRHRELTHSIKWDLLVVDEHHYLKNKKTQRAKEIYGAWDKKERKKNPEPLHANKKLFLSGTPIENKPIELWPILQYLDPDHWKNWKYFVTRYCAGYEGRFGWDVSGASNTEELNLKLRSTIMIRRLKKEVLPELPPKIRQVIELTASGTANLIKAQYETYQKYQGDIEKHQANAENSQKLGHSDGFVRSIERLRESQTAAFVEMSKIRHQLAMKKLPHVIDHLHDIVDSGEKVVIFGHHRDFLQRIKDEFGEKAILLIGGMTDTAQQDAVDKFQNDPRVKVFVGNMKAAGTGRTLTASSHIVFGELSWVPSDLTQAEDRCHRIGATGESILIQHLVFEGSLDAQMAKTIIQKQEVISSVLDGEK